MNQLEMLNMKEPIPKEALRDIEKKKDEMLHLNQAGLELDDWELYKLYKKQTTIDDIMIPITSCLLGVFLGVFLSILLLL